MRTDRPPVAAAAAWSLVGLDSDLQPDPAVPWGTIPMVREFSPELRRLEDTAFDLKQFIVLAWKTERREDDGYLVEIAVLWARMRADVAPTAWAPSGKRCRPGAVVGGK